MNKPIATACFIFAISTPAFAADKVVLPPDAKMLTAAEVIAAYDGKSYAWDHPNTDKVKGTVTFDFKKGYMSGTWNDGKSKGEWEGKITMKGDQYCYRTKPKGGKKFSNTTCNILYTDGKMIYETHPKSKKVLSTDVLM
jgi:Protein of unknown function (DUF995)